MFVKKLTSVTLKNIFDTYIFTFTLMGGHMKIFLMMNISVKTHRTNAAQPSIVITWLVLKHRSDKWVKQTKKL